MKTGTKFTPGPWLVKPNRNDLDVYASAYRVATVLAGDAIVDPALALEGDQREASTELEANARLIAAAPELLEALRECITSEGATCFGDMENHPEWMQRRLYAISDIARAAIAKAEGTNE